MDPARAGCGGGVVDRDAAAAEERPGSRGSRRAHRPLLRRAGPARAAFRDARPHRDLRQASPRAGDRDQAAAERRAQPRRHHRDVAHPRRPHARAAHGSLAAGARGAPRVVDECAGVERPFTLAWRRGSGRSPDRARAGRRRLHRAARGRISHIRRRSRAPRGRGTVRCRARKTRAHRPGPGHPGGAMSALPIVLMTEEEVAALGRDSDAGFGALRSERGLLPLAAMDVDARVAGVVASIDVAQTFVNTTGQAIEATYIFPLPDRAAVHRFRMEVAGRVIEGVVDERGAARERYDEAIAKGHRAAITEEERAGVFTLRVGNLMPGELATSLGCLDVADGKAGTFMLTFVPPTTTAVAAKPRDVVFLLDRSGSMEGWKMVAARRALARMIDTLTSRDRFSVLAFDDRIEIIPGSLAPASDRTRFRAVEQFAMIDARGGTELAEPRELAMRAFGSTYDDRERVIVLVTDGQVGNEDHLLRSAAGGLKNIRMFTLGIDQAVNGAFLKRLASAGGGLCELVESEDRLDQVMAKVHRRIGVPVATELASTGSGLDLSRATVTPKKLPDVYAGSPVVIFGRYGGTAPSDATIAVEGTSIGDPLQLTIARDPLARGPAGWLAASWARAYIRDLEDRYATGDHAVEATIVKTSKQFTVLSRFSAFLAVDASEVVNRGGRFMLVVQPVDAPAGCDMLERTATAAPARAFAVGAAGGGGPAQARGGAMKTMAMAPSAPAPMLDDDLCDAEASEVGESAPAAQAFDARRAFAPSAPSGGMPGGRVPSAPSGAMPGGRVPSAPPGAMRKRSAPPAPAASRPAPAMPPPAMPFAPAPKPPARHPLEADEAKREAGDATVGNAYLLQLAQLARELAAHAGGPNVASIRMLRQRLTEWIEDVRSVGGQAALADTVEKLVQRLAAALAGADLASEAKAIADALAMLAGGAPPPEAPKKSRLAFWK